MMYMGAVCALRAAVGCREEEEARSAAAAEALG